MSYCIQINGINHNLKYRLNIYDSHITKLDRFPNLYFSSPISLSSLPLFISFSSSLVLNGWGLFYSGEEGIISIKNSRGIFLVP